MNTPESLRNLALLILKRAQISAQGAKLTQAVRSSSAFGAVTHHAACLLLHIGEIELLLSSIPAAARKDAEVAVLQAIMAGQHVARLKQRQHKKPITITKQERALLAKAAKRKEQQVYRKRRQ